MKSGLYMEPGLDMTDITAAWAKRLKPPVTMASTVSRGSGVFTAPNSGPFSAGAAWRGSGVTPGAGGGKPPGVTRGAGGGMPPGVYCVMGGSSSLARGSAGISSGAGAAAGGGANADKSTMASS